jgi:DNA-binding winged helix-turn-helix (wHTH) protein
MSGREAGVVYQFGDFALDAMAYELTRGGQRVHLARQPMEVLLLLASKAGELVPRADIGRCLWQEGVFVDQETGIHSVVLKIRRALGDASRTSTYIETVSGKGYRFTADVSRRARPAGDVHAGALPRREAPGVGRRHNLPAELTSFLGRRAELELLQQLLAASRLVTLVGAGGIGKTRLAVRLASAVVDTCVDGAWIADLSPLSAPDLVVQTLASSLGVRESSHRSIRDALMEYVRDRHLLLVIDTCEHLVDACAELTEALLRAAPHLRVVATSREALGVPGEVVYRVPSLSVPPETLGGLSIDSLASADATRLFIDRATAVDPTFSVTADNVLPIASVCRRLDGIPLAIELAAASESIESPPSVSAGTESEGTR